MDDRELQAAEALDRLHPAIGRLFRTGHELIAKELQPGDEYLLAISGRVLSDGLGVLLDPLVDPVIWPAESVDDGERHRAKLGNLLGLPVADPMVTEWFAAHQAFNRFAHWPPRDPADLIRHFRNLSAILTSWLGPFFASQDVLNELAALSSPGSNDAERLRPLLLLPAQREWFFERVSSPEWLPFLLELRSFDRLPSTPPSDKWKQLARWASWPEGSYLARIAEQRAGEVQQILLGAPSKSENPLVWRRVIAAALNLPVSLSRPIAEALRTRIIRSLPTPYFVYDALKLIVRLAVDKAPESISLVEAFLHVESPNSEGGSSSVTPSRTRFDAEPIFVFLRTVEIEELGTKVFPALLENLPTETFDLLIGRLRRVIAAEGDDPTTSKRWCRDLEERSPNAGAREVILQALATTAVAICQQLPRDAGEHVLHVLSKEHHDSFTRVLWHTLARAGDRFVEQATEALCDDRLLHSWWGSREAALLLRERLPTSQPLVQHVVLHGFERGPSPAELRSRWDFDAAGDASVMRTWVQGWQRERLRWFRGDIPPILHALSAELGVLGSVPGIEEQMLAEDHFYSGSGRWVSPNPPLSGADWGALGTGDQLAFLVSWEPKSEGPFHDDETRGLLQMLQAWAGEKPGDAIALLTHAEDTVPMYVVAPIVRGLREVADRTQKIEFGFIGRVAALTVLSAADGNRERSDKERLAEGVLDLVEVAAVRDGMTEDDFLCTIPMLQMMAGNQLVWEQADVVLHQEGLARAEAHAWNSLAGRLMGAAIDIGLSMYRNRAGSDRDESYDSSETQSRILREVVPILERGVNADGMPGLGARFRIGGSLPQIRLLAPSWVSDAVVPLFAKGISEPDEEPVWAAYLLRSSLYDSVYERWREWYAQAAAIMPAQVRGFERDRTPLHELCLHLTVAFLRGLETIEDPGGPLPTAYIRLPADSRSSIYWQLWRGLTDTEGELPGPFLNRVEAFWQWRLEVLGSRDDDEVEKEADGLCWFAVLDKLPAPTVLTLGLPTVRLLKSKASILGHVWDHLNRLIDEDPEATLRLVTEMISAEARTEYPYLNFGKIQLICRELRRRVSEGAWGQFADSLDGLARKGWTQLRQLLE